MHGDFKKCERGCGTQVANDRRFVFTHGRRGAKHSDETRAAISATVRKLGIKPPPPTPGMGNYAATKGMKLRARSEESKQRSSIALKNSPAMKAHIERMKVDRKGPGNPAWKGGKSQLPYAYTWNGKFQEEVRIKHGKFCHICWATVNSREYEMDVHHIDDNKLNMHDDNFVVLCHSCHQKITMGKWIMRVFDRETGQLITPAVNPDRNEWRRRVSEKLKGRPKSPEHRAKLHLSLMKAREAKRQRLQV